MPLTVCAEDRTSESISGPGTKAFVALAVVLPAIQGGENGREFSLRTLDSLLTATLLSEGLKRLTRVPRPDTGTPDSFPSGHATAAFAVATIAAERDPRAAPFWYAGAFAIAQSRVKLNRHRETDVLAGALLGLAVGRIELASPSGLLFRVNNDGSKSVGFGLRF
ncbi:MAG: phosphatase PAP2 family protein [Armatimonadota bacterium]